MVYKTVQLVSLILIAIFIGIGPLKANPILGLRRYILAVRPPIHDNLRWYSIRKPTPASSYLFKSLNVGLIKFSLCNAGF